MKSTVKHVVLAATLSVAAAGFGSALVSTVDAQDVTPASGAAPVQAQHNRLVLSPIAAN